MKLTSVTDDSLTLLLHPHEIRILHQMMNLCGAGFGLIKNYSPFIPSLIEGVSPLDLTHKLSDHTPDYRADEVYWGDPEYETKSPVPQEEYVSISLSLIEWTACLYLMVAATFGCLVSENDLVCLTGFRPQEMKIVIDSLQGEIRDHVRRLARDHKRQQRREKTQNGE